MRPIGTSQRLITPVLLQGEERFCLPNESISFSRAEVLEFIELYEARFHVHLQFEEALKRATDFVALLQIVWLSDANKQGNMSIADQNAENSKEFTAQ